MKRAAALFLLGAQLLCAALPESIQKLLDSSPAARTAFWGIQIVDLATGKTLYELNPDHYFVPASNVKLFSTALALTRLGADFTFQTNKVASWKRASGSWRPAWRRRCAAWRPCRTSQRGSTLRWRNSQAILGLPMRRGTGFRAATGWP